MSRPVYAFVDIDGVLNTPPTWGKRGMGALEPTRVNVLDDFCRETGAAVVVSSTWRKILSLEDITELLRRVGLTAPIAGVTPILLDARRFEIVQWIDANAPDCYFVIFDDDRDADIVGHFVHIEGSQGLTRDHTARAKALLERAQRAADAVVRRAGAKV